MFFKRKKKEVVTELIVHAPIKGTVVGLNQLEDKAFSSKSMGEGFAILPNEGKVFAPFDGTVAHVMGKSKHAIVLEHESGVQMLIHIGMDTVSLKGQGFQLHVAVGDKIKKGQLLIEFDLHLIKAEGYSTLTPVIVPVGQDLVKQVDVLMQDNHLTVLSDELLKINL